MEEPWWVPAIAAVISGGPWLLCLIANITGRRDEAPPPAFDATYRERAARNRRMR